MRSNKDMTMFKKLSKEEQDRIYETFFLEHWLKNGTNKIEKMGNKLVSFEKVFDTLIDALEFAEEHDLNTVYTKKNKFYV